jgi:hypothetical protein
MVASEPLLILLFCFFTAWRLPSLYLYEAGSVQGQTPPPPPHPQTWPPETRLPPWTWHTGGGAARSHNQEEGAGLVGPTTVRRTGSHGGTIEMRN